MYRGAKLEIKHLYLQSTFVLPSEFEGANFTKLTSNTITLGRDDLKNAGQSPSFPILSSAEMDTSFIIYLPY